MSRAADGPRPFSGVVIVVLLAASVPAIADAVSPAHSLGVTALSSVAPASAEAPRVHENSPRHPVPLLGAPLAGGQGRLIVNSTDPAIVPNSGLRTNITNYFALPFTANSAFQVAAAETIGPFVAVFGIFQNDQLYPVPFFSVFSNSTDATLHLAYWSNLTLVGGQSYDFELVRTVGTNWTLTMNGVLFDFNRSQATFDFQASEAIWAGGVSFSEVALYSGTLTTPSVVEVPLAFATLRTGGWYLPDAARCYLVTAQAGWGAVGRNQNTTLAPGELVTGASITPASNGTLLWAGGPVPVNVYLNLESSTTRGTTIVAASATVLSQTGSPLGGVPLAFSDSAGSTFTPASGTTDATGFLSTFVGTANVTSTTLDTVRVGVTLLGYVGNASVLLTVTPPIQLFLNVSPPSPEAFTSRSITMTVVAADPTGTPGAGVLLLASVLVGRASVTPFTTTDARGVATLVFTAPPTPSVVPIILLVVAPGYWGHASVNVTIRASPTPLLTVLEPYLVGAAIALAGVGIVMGLRARRRRRPPLPIPKLGLPGDEDASSSVSESTATRTPP